VLEQVCEYLNNYFTRKSGIEYDRWKGEFTIENGELTRNGATLDGLKPGNYFLIRGSDFNDGVHVCPAEDLTDETFTGWVYKMVPPVTFLALVDEIDAWQKKYEAVVKSPYQSESFAGYSYTKRGGFFASGVDSTAAWESIFAIRLKKWRKLYEYL